MDSHLLFELTYVLYRVCSAIIHGKRWLVESSRKFCLFYPSCKWWFRNLAQRLFHNVSSYSLARRAPAFPSKTASIRVDGMHIAFLIVLMISFTFKIEKLILLTNISRLRLMRACLMWTWSYHDELLYYTCAQALPTNGANCRVTIWSPSPIWLGYKSNEPSTINL